VQEVTMADGTRQRFSIGELCLETLSATRRSPW
jgi:hypothetical protein